jgi:acyl-CoA thioesterase-1
MIRLVLRSGTALALLLAAACSSNPDSAADENLPEAAGTADTAGSAGPVGDASGGVNTGSVATGGNRGGGAGSEGGSPDGGTDGGTEGGTDAVIDGVAGDGRHTGGARIACVGDSITVGLGSTDQGKKSYPARLQALLGASFPVENDGHSGATMLKSEVFGGSYWSTSEFARAHAFSPDIVIIALGTNDMNIYDWDHHDQFAGDYAAMIDDFRALASHPDIYVCLPPWVMTDKAEVGLTEDRMSNVIIPAIRSVAASKATPIIDFHGLTKDHTEYYHDEIHPNDAGYAAMAAAVESAVLK